jgi:uncharacterized protein YebE (UPF0316 family)
MDGNLIAILLCLIVIVLGVVMMVFRVTWSMKIKRKFDAMSGKFSEILYFLRIETLAVEDNQNTNRNPPSYEDVSHKLNHFDPVLPSYQQAMKIQKF